MILTCMLADERCVAEMTRTYPYACKDGIPVEGMSTRWDTEKCESCDIGFTKQTDETCLGDFDYVCDNGTPTEGRADRPNVTSCASCDAGGIS